MLLDMLVLKSLFTWAKLARLFVIHLQFSNPNVICFVIFGSYVQQAMKPHLLKTLGNQRFTQLKAWYLKSHAEKIVPIEVK